MGLDSVELVLAWEEAFAISIPEEESVKMYTSRQAAAWIYARVRSMRPEDDGCLAMRAFGKLRAAFGRVGVPRRSVHPDAKVAVQLPGRDRREVLNLVREGAGLPPLRKLPFGLQFTFGRVRDMVLDSVIGQHAALRRPGHGWSLNQVREVVRAVMHAQLALRRFSDDAEIVKDLGVD